MNITAPTFPSAPGLESGPAHLCELGKELCRAWADRFDQVHAGTRDPEALRRIQQEEIGLRQVMDHVDRARRAMALLDFDLFICTLIYYRSVSISQQKVREVRMIIGEELSRRVFWDKLAEVHYYAAGLVVMGRYLSAD